MVQDKGKLVHAHPANELTEKQFGFESVINKTATLDAAGTSQAILSADVDAGKIWKITHVTTWNHDGGVTGKIAMYVNHNGTNMGFHTKIAASAQYETVDKHVELYLDADDYIRVDFVGVTIGNTLALNIFGYEMNAP